MFWWAGQASMQGAAMQSKGPSGRLALEDERAARGGRSGRSLGDDPLGVAGEVPAARRARPRWPATKRVEARRRPRASIAALEVRQVLLEAGVAARLEQVGADGDRADAVGDEVGEVPGVGAAAEADRHLPVELLGRRAGPASRVSGWSARPDMYIIFSFGREDGAVVDDLEGVGELEAELLRPAALAAAARRLTIGMASSNFGSCPKAASGHLDVEAERAR